MGESRGEHLGSRETPKSNQDGSLEAPWVKGSQKGKKPSKTSTTFKNNRRGLTGRGGKERI